MKQLSPKLYKVWLYLILLILGYILAGWLLTVFQVSIWVWVITLAIILYLAKTGSEGIVLGSAGVMGIIFFGVIFRVWPKIWPRKIRLQDIPVGSGTRPKPIMLWPVTYILLWLFAILLVLGLAFAHKPLKFLGLNPQQCFYCLTLLSGLSLGIGVLIFKSSLFNFI